MCLIFPNSHLYAISSAIAVAIGTIYIIIYNLKSTGSRTDPWGHKKHMQLWTSVHCRLEWTAIICQIWTQPLHHATGNTESVGYSSLAIRLFLSIVSNAVELQQQRSRSAVSRTIDIIQNLYNCCFRWVATLLDWDWKRLLLGYHS